MILTGLITEVGVWGEERNPFPSYGSGPVEVRLYTDQGKGDRFKHLGSQTHLRPLQRPDPGGQEQRDADLRRDQKWAEEDFRGGS